MGRLPRGMITGIKRYTGGPNWEGSIARLKRRVAAGRDVKLYRGSPVKGRSGLHRVRSVRKGQSWAATPHTALTFAAPRGLRPGQAGLLYSITVPARELRGTLQREIYGSGDHDQVSWTWGGSKRVRDRLSFLGAIDEWSYMRDWVGRKGQFGPEADRLELRPNRARPDLKPKIVGTVEMGRDGKLRYGFTRRLERRRGVPVRGGGA